MNLFKVVDSRNGKVVEQGFSKKKDAKILRMKMNKKVDGKPEKFTHIVRRSEEHWKGPSIQTGKKKARY